MLDLDSLDLDAPAGAPRTSGRFFAGGYEAARASLNGPRTWPSPLELELTRRNLHGGAWDISSNELLVLNALLSWANRDWLVLAAGRWLGETTRLGEHPLRAALAELERKGYVRRLRSGNRKQPLVVALRQIGYLEHGDRPQGWTPPANPKRRRGQADTKRIGRLIDRTARTGSVAA